MPPNSFIPQPQKEGWMKRFFNKLKLQNRQDARFAKILSLTFTIIAGYIFHFTYNPLIYTVTDGGSLGMIKSFIDLPMTLLLIIPALLTGGGIMYLFFFPGFEFIVFVIPSFIFWFYVFYGISFLIRKIVGQDIYPIVAFIPSMALAFLLLSPFWGLTSTSGDGLVTQAARCLSGEFRGKDLDPYDQGSPDNCLTEILTGLDGLIFTSTSEEVIDFCISLSDTLLVDLRETDAFEEYEYLPRDITYQEYCIYKIGNDLNPVYSTHLVPGRIEYDFYQRYKTNDLPDIQLITSLYNEWLSLLDGDESRREAVKKERNLYYFLYLDKMCEVYAEKTNIPSKKEQCVKNFVNKALFNDQPVPAGVLSMWGR